MISENKIVRIQKGQVVALFAFDIGYEIDLEHLSRLITTAPIAPISRKKLTPAYLQFSRPPQVLHLGAAPALFPAPGTIQATAFDFGGVSLAYRWPLAAGCSLTELPALSRALYEQNLELHAREAIEKLFGRINSAVTRPGISELVEDYFLFIVEEFDQDWKAEALLRDHRATLAQTLRFETTPLSEAQQTEALSQRISYYENDLVVTDWNAALICDRAYEDTVSVLELLNVELLEARFIDAQMDKRIARYSRLVRRPIEWPIPLRTPYKQEIQELAELRIESALLEERVNNSLKLIGDLYLARVHSSAARRFYLQEWEQVIANKLELISGFYELLTDRVRTAQSQTMELIIVILILVELMMAIFH